MGDALTTYKATDESWAPGMPDGACDVIYSRMVYHMLPIAVAQSYPAQWRRSLKPSGKAFITDHNPLTMRASGERTGPRRPIISIAGWGPMPVVPQYTDQAEIEAGGFVTVEGPFPWEFYEGGYGAVYVPEGTATARASDSYPG